MTPRRARRRAPKRWWLGLFGLGRVFGHKRIHKHKGKWYYAGPYLRKGGG